MLASPQPMHIPDGFLTVLISIVFWAISAVVISFALKRVSAEMDERRIPLMGVLAAAIFAGQMLNFSVAFGSSGHLMGAALAAILLGPWPAILVMTAVVSIQALIFQDGGLVVLGANLFNMGIAGVAVAYMVHRTVSTLGRGQRWSLFAGGFLAGWFSVVISALLVALQLAASGRFPANLAIPAMGGIHLLIGLGEGLITVGALAFLTSARPGLLAESGPDRPSTRMVWAAGLLIALALILIAPWASANPDGLEWVAEQQGFIHLARDPLYNLVPDYILPGMENSGLATIAAGALGVLLVFGATLLVGLVRRKSPNP
jgi:cobalt/nickel transport system permease protein